MATLPKFQNMVVKSTGWGDYRATFKLAAIMEREGVDRLTAMNRAEDLACYEATRADAENSARAMARIWALEA